VVLDKTAPAHNVDIVNEGREHAEPHPGLRGDAALGKACRNVECAYVGHGNWWPGGNIARHRPCPLHGPNGGTLLKRRGHEPQAAARIEQAARLGTIDHHQKRVRGWCRAQRVVNHKRRGRAINAAEKFILYGGDGRNSKPPSARACNPSGWSHAYATNGRRHSCKVGR
jgi:hypothetical protein